MLLVGREEGGKLLYLRVKLFGRESQFGAKPQGFDELCVRSREFTLFPQWIGQIDFFEEFV
jgi:hypothetical protein